VARMPFTLTVSTLNINEPEDVMTT
jgi:hypothetical protein